ncbi:MAG: alanine racemase [Thermoanaerobaculia bacterium]
MRPTFASVDLSSIAHNFHLLQRLSGRRVLAVVKADAYGHGAARVARALEAAGADFFCVAIAEEGVALRRAGIRSPILLLNSCGGGEAPLYRALALTPTLFSVDQARDFAAATAAFSRPLAVHVKLDTGLTRLGVMPEEIPALAEVLRRAPGLRVEAAFTHFSHGDEPESPELASQEERSKSAFAALRAAGLQPDWTHLANSGAAMAGKGAWTDAVRPGLSLYGVSPAAGLGSELRPALSWETEVVAVKRVASGTPVGYGGAFVTTRESILAVLAIGYDDGYRRSFGGKVPVLFAGGAARTVGVISMDLTVCDTTDLEVRRGDRTVLLGATPAGAVSAHDLARAAETIPYEILCGIGARVPRRYS